jgi:glycosyltransferase EpsE
VDQTYQDWEFIICNDASTDGTWQKVLAWTEKDKRISASENERNLALPLPQPPAGTGERRVYSPHGRRRRIFAGPLRKTGSVSGPESRVCVRRLSCYLFDESGEWGMRKTIEKPQKENFLWAPDSRIRP